MKIDNVEDVYRIIINSKTIKCYETRPTVSEPAAYSIAEAPCICSTVFGYAESPCSTSSSCVAINDGFAVPFSYAYKPSSFRTSMISPSTTTNHFLPDISQRVLIELVDILPRLPRTPHVVGAREPGREVLHYGADCQPHFPKPLRV
jgi:hypothetical protein